MDQPLVILGASTRAAAFSALRAGLRPSCIDLFADADLRSRCTATTIAPADYPQGFVPLLRDAPPAPWMYTGAMENRPQLVHRLAQLRPLWGNDSSVLAAARSPGKMRKLLRSAGLACPGISCAASPPPGRWLIKPREGAGGKGIRHHRASAAPRRDRRFYYQEYIEGENCAAIYVGHPSETRLLGVTRQLVGESWLRAAAFHYCGSIGPLALSGPVRQALEALGTILARGCGLLGLFGVDFILRDGIPWPVEINPRYTASIEVLEYATGFSAVGWHRRVFDSTAPVPSSGPASISAASIGKAILFAKAPLIFPSEGPWLGTLQAGGSVNDPPAFADIPAAGQAIAAGRPILTLFSRGDTPDACLGSLQ